MFLDPRILDIEQVRQRGDIPYGSSGSTTDLRQVFAGTPMETLRGRMPVRRRPCEWMIRTVLDLPYAMLADLEAAPGSDDIIEVLRSNLAAAEHGRATDAAGIRSDRYVTHDARCENLAMPLTTKRVRQAS